MLIKFLKNKFIYFKLLIIFLSFLFIFNIILKDFNLLLENLSFHEKVFDLIIIFFLTVIAQYFSSARFFIIFKLLFNYSEKFLNWNKFFFYTSLMNISFFGVGHIDRAILIKKKGVRYIDYISSIFIVNLLSIFIYLTIFSLIYLKYYIIFFLFLLFFLINILFKKFFYFFHKKKFSIKIFNKNIIITEKIKSFLIIFFSNKKNIFIFIVFTLLIFAFELGIFYSICTCGICVLFTL